MFDCFVAALLCSHCGNVSPATSVTNMQTHVRGGGADGSELAVGAPLKPAYLTTQHLQGAGYSLIGQSPAEGSVRLLDVWTCPECEAEQWALIETLDSRIERIEAVVMNRATLEAATFISDADAVLLAEAISGLSHSELAKRKVGIVEVLRQRLE